MASASDIHGSVFKNATCANLARVVGHEGAPAMQADFGYFGPGSSSSSGECGPPAVKYSIYLLDDQDSDSRADVSGHTAVPLAVEDVFFDELQNDAIWNAALPADDLGYNFRHTPEIIDDPAFTVAGRRYLVEYTFCPIVGQPFLIRFFLDCK